MKPSAVLPRRGVMVAGAVALALTGDALGATQLPGQSSPPRQPADYAQYGEPIPVELWDVSRGSERYQKRAVRTTGWLEPFDQGHFRLADTGAAVLLIPTDEMRAALHSLMGRRLEVEGVVRALREPQSPCGPFHWSICEDPDLPQLPDLTPERFSWPRVSLTSWAVTDMTERTPAGERDGAGQLLEAVAQRPEDYAGTTLTLVGQFRGHNLFGDLPARVWGRDDDWVIRSGGHAVWVSGKRPRGKGWALALDEESDSRFWLQVTGKVVVVGGVACIKAKQVAMARSR